MKSWSAWLASGPFALACLLGCGPTLLMPGGELSGPVEAVPADWGFSDEISTIQLETRPSEPYSVNIWAVGMGDRLYVHAGANRSRWVEHLIADPSARVRVGGKLYLVTAVRVVEPSEFAAFADAYKKKYGVRPRNENVAEVYLYRLGARS
ncbi:DUF2255 family protein [Myxococcota bacterium]|nr:DUF2255 family protein [Myxococcota bacterium]